MLQLPLSLVSNPRAGKQYFPSARDFFRSEVNYGVLGQNMEPNPIAGIPIYDTGIYIKDPDEKVPASYLRLLYRDISGNDYEEYYRFEFDPLDRSGSRIREEFPYDKPGVDSSFNMQRVLWHLDRIEVRQTRVRPGAAGRCGNIRGPDEACIAGSY